MSGTAADYLQAGPRDLDRSVDAARANIPPNDADQGEEQPRRSGQRREFEFPVPGGDRGWLRLLDNRDPRLGADFHGEFFPLVADRFHESFEPGDFRAHHLQFDGRPAHRLGLLLRVGKLFLHQLLFGFEKADLRREPRGPSRARGRFAAFELFADSGPLLGELLLDGRKIHLVAQKREPAVETTVGVSLASFRPSRARRIEIKYQRYVLAGSVR